MEEVLSYGVMYRYDLLGFVFAVNCCIGGQVPHCVPYPTDLQPINVWDPQGPFGTLWDPIS